MQIRGTDDDRDVAHLSKEREEAEIKNFTNRGTPS